MSEGRFVGVRHASAGYGSPRLHRDGADADAVGRGARVEIRSGIAAKEPAELFSPIYQKIASRPPDPSVEKDEISDRVKRIEKEVATGDKAEPAKVERWLRNLAVALGNAPSTPAVLAALESRREHASELVREHVAWALAQHEKRGQTP